MFDEAYAKFWAEQVRAADGQRKEMLEKDLTGTRLLLEKVLLPVLGSFEGMELEYEIVNLSGVRLYGDVYHYRLRTVFEEDHYTTHAEKITRRRFSFERGRARTFAVLGLRYFPFSRDELEQFPELCRRDLSELIARASGYEQSGLMQRSVYERELLRCALLRHRPFRLSDVSEWLQLGKETSRKFVRNLQIDGFIAALGGGEHRCHEFEITNKGVALLLSNKL
ncbi:hypothetical protein COLU111180_18480 [Cohnella lubricantis]|uniref:Uncharacterized protein n=1 Tax=Cohnella lubricantis TaxID=2163172 RepID=A0A841TK59_9BACL|nr:hypothetical protein [Cohnella lubricantis]MBB6679580.1 hypothetical protein [Cohnella lubricantis]MBP2120574.1 hypothetical protein [Cohnella lubricantis]